MSNKTESARAVCPFWRDSSGKKIRCEGIVSMNIENGFESVRERELHEAHFCDALYRYCECPVARAILSRLQNDENG